MQTFEDYITAGITKFREMEDSDPLKRFMATTLIRDITIHADKLDRELVNGLLSQIEEEGVI